MCKPFNRQGIANFEKYAKHGFLTLRMCPADGHSFSMMDAK
jgi:hypothetical protein